MLVANVCTDNDTTVLDLILADNNDKTALIYCVNKHTGKDNAVVIM